MSEAGTSAASAIHATPVAEPEPFRSASGVRPAFAFVLIGFVLALVAARAAIIAVWEKGEQPPNLTRLPVLPVQFDLVDSDGVPLATSIEYLELVMSPNAMWQAHTPRPMARSLAAALGTPGREGELLARMMPDAVDGVVTCTRAPLLMDEAAMRRVLRWLAHGSLDASRDPAPIHGMQVARTTVPGKYAIQWRPEVLLDQAERERHGVKKPLDWSRRLADELHAAVSGETEDERADTDDEQNDARAAIWLALMPTQFRSLVKEVPITRAQAIHAVLKAERVQQHQMEIKRNSKRVYPVKGDASHPGSVAVLGRWGTLDVDVARKAARKDLGLPEDDTLWSLEQEIDWRERTTKLVFQPSPMCGLELLVDRLLASPEHASWLQRVGEEYTFLANQAPRQPPHRYFQELVPADETPRVVTTIEIGVQRQLRLALERTMDEHRPALAMAVALDVATGNVLAVDAIDPYEMGGFLPTMHTFTPGSTMKAVVMACALHEGLVRPDERIDAHHNTFVFEGRPIHEADGAKDKDLVTAAEALAYSINAVMVQVGTRMPADVLRQHFLDLGYAQYPGAALGNERCGGLKKLPWARKYTHASVSFGHEMFVTLWQHAASMATILRGGHYRPLRLVRAVEQYGVTKPIPLVEDHALQARDSLSPRACADVREMMMLGARIGTGKPVFQPDIVMGTKTGTAQKVPGEVCLHVELQHNREHGCRGAAACRAALADRHVHSGACYTSSMCIFGRRLDGGREVMVLVVVDEPRGARHFGSQVAGPAAKAILREALGLTRDGEEAEPLDARGFHAISFVPPGASDQPWAEVGRASR